MERESSALLEESCHLSESILSLHYRQARLFPRQVQDALPGIVGRWRSNVGALTFIPKRGVSRSLTSALAESPMAFSSSRRRLLTRAQGRTKSGIRSVKILRGHEGCRQKNLRTESRSTTLRPAHGASWTVRVTMDLFSRTATLGTDCTGLCGDHLYGELGFRRLNQGI